jgi:hypothetical protein
VLASATETAKSIRRLAERAIEQVSDAQLHEPLPGDHNTIAILMQHLAGNMRSRWTDVLTTDGEKPWRKRDNEFVDLGQSREELMTTWSAGWECFFNALASLTEHDLTRSVQVRGKQLSVVEAIEGQLVHYGTHVGQIVMIARILVGPGWRVLSIPLGQSEQYNRKMWQK